MVAKKCDICGKLYEEKPLSLVEEIEDTINGLIPFVTSKDIIKAFERELDICFECSNALLQTVKEIRGANNA